MTLLIEGLQAAMQEVLVPATRLRQAIPIFDPTVEDGIAEGSRVLLALH
jgi:hypothetical protein